MTRRPTPQHALDDIAFPIRVKVRLPAAGPGPALAEVLQWINVTVGPDHYAQHPAESLGGDARAFYFRQIEHALDFLSAFPELDLADGTTSRGYRSPLVRRWRTG